MVECQVGFLFTNHGGLIYGWSCIGGLKVLGAVSLACGFLFLRLVMLHNGGVSYEIFFLENPCVLYTGFESLEAALAYETFDSRLRAYNWTPMVYRATPEKRELVYDGRPEHRRVWPINLNEW